MSLEILLLIGVVAGAIGYRVANGKGRDGLVWGVLCFFIPILVLLVLIVGPGSGVPAGYRRCPHCAEPIHKAANVCRHCRGDVTPAQQSTGHATRPCPHCGADMDNGARVCVSCGKSVSF